MSRNNNGGEPEATPLVAAHVDEELLTRKKYFEKKRKEQQDELERERRDKEKKLYEKRAKDEADAKAEHARRMDAFDRKLVEDHEREHRRRTNEENAKVSRYLADRAKRESEEKEILEWIQSQQDQRRHAEWAYKHPQEAAAEAREEAAAYVNKRKSLEETARIKIELGAQEHEKKMEQIGREAVDSGQRWLAMKPVLIGAMLGGAFGLWLTPDPSSHL